MNEADDLQKIINHAAVLAVQDATNYLRNVSTIATSAVGAAEQLIVQGHPHEEATHIVEIAESATAMARANLAAMVELASALTSHARPSPS
jgi:hypothetical protein